MCCFNLVIENLLFSTILSSFGVNATGCFNLVIENLLFSTIPIDDVRGFMIDECFNLVIENLLFSTLLLLHQNRLLYHRFNLVIENLLFSTKMRNIGQGVNPLFQSRNRESFIFYQDFG